VQQSQYKDKDEEHCSASFLSYPCQCSEVEDIVKGKFSLLIEFYYLNIFLAENVKATHILKKERIFITIRIVGFLL